MHLTGNPLYLLPLSFIGMLFAFNRHPMQENHPPKVKIIQPKNNAAVVVNSTVHYAISVEDPEDGNSEYDEIQPKEVLLEVKYLPASTREKNIPAADDAVKMRVLETMLRSNCFNCHSFSEKSIGPSYFEIQKKYAGQQAATDLLSKHIREGSSGIWGKVTMPSHPELTVTDTRQLVKWILAAAADTTVNYYTGTSGSFRIKSFSSKTNTGSCRLTARYTDHGRKEDASGKMRGEDKVIVFIK